MTDRPDGGPTSLCWAILALSWVYMIYIEPFAADMLASLKILKFPEWSGVEEPTCLGPGDLSAALGKMALQAL